MSTITTINSTDAISDSRGVINTNFGNLNTDKVEKNEAITGATKTKITYDAKGLVTVGVDATTADIADSTDKRYCTDAQKTVIGNTSGTNSGDNAANTSIVATKLDDFTAPDDNTDLDASTTKHGLLLKATAPAAGLVNVVGITNGETAYTNKAIFDATVPSTQAFGDAAATGSATVSARRDHKHAMPAAEKDTTAVTGVLKGNGSAISACSNLTDVAIPVKATGAEITTGTDDAKFATSKALADAGVNTRLKTKVIAITRDMTAGTADVAYTGVGFTPTALIAVGSINGSYPFMTGVADSSKGSGEIFQYGANTVYADTNFITLATAGGVAQTAIIKTYDADGFTLTWTKSGSPTGTATIYILCFR